MEFCVANSKEPGVAGGDSKPGVVARSLVELNVYQTPIQTCRYRRKIVLHF